MRLTYTKIDGTPAEVQPTEKPITIGRSTEANVVVEDGEVSRIHCSLRIQDGACFLKDLHSSNGTWVNGKQISEVKLKDGDCICIGETQFMFEGDKLSRPGTQTIFRQTEEEMAAGKGYGTIMRKIVSELDPPKPGAPGSKPPALG